MILNFAIGFIFGLLFALIALLAIALDNIREKKRNNSSTFDWDKGEYNRGVEDTEDKEKN